MKQINLILVVVCCISCSHKVYVVRHAERADAGTNTMMSSDPPLSAEGTKRAEYLQQLFTAKKIAAVYSTNTVRTKSTAKPTADYFKLPINIYGPRPDSVFVNRIKILKKNSLIVGHSNTVDDVVNLLLNKAQLSDLPEEEYNKLYIITVKGKKTKLKEGKIYTN